MFMISLWLVYLKRCFECIAETPRSQRCLCLFLRDQTHEFDACAIA
jgi:hypothetical protein